MRNLALAFLFLMSTFAKAESEVPVRPVPASDPEALSGALMQQALADPGVQAAIIEAGEIEAVGAGDFRPEMIEMGPKVADKKKSKSKNGIRNEKKFGIDARLGAPSGLGVGFHYSIIAPVTVGVAFDTTGLTYSLTAQATVNILPIFGQNGRFTPTVSVEFTHLRFTGLTSSLIEGANPYLKSRGIEVDMNGVWMNTVSLLAGIDYIGPAGFHFNVSGGRLMQVGDSGGGDGRDGIVLRGWQSYVVNTAVGFQW